MDAHAGETGKKLGGDTNVEGTKRTGGISAESFYTPEERAARERQEFESRVMGILKCASFAFCLVS